MTVVKTADSDRIRGNEEREIETLDSLFNSEIQHTAKSQDRVYRMCVRLYVKISFISFYAAV